MWSTIKFSGILSLISVIQAVPTSHQRRATPVCTDFLIPVKATAPVKSIDPSLIPTDFSDAASVADFITSQATSGLAALLGLAGTTMIIGEFNMGARYCEPTNSIANRTDTIQYLQHAITYTKDYWNGLSYPEGFDDSRYSWLNVASDNGFPTLSIDNLGSGASDHPDPVTVVQQSLQIEIAHQIISGLRNGSLGGPLQGKTFNKVIYAGHSYGSIAGNGLASIYPNDVDAFVFTGYTKNFIMGTVPLAAGVTLPASTVSSRFAGLDPLYLADSSVSGRQYGLYTVNGVGGFDPDILPYDLAHEGTVAVGELATLFYGLYSAPDYKGLVFVLTGHQDAIACNTPLGADCGTGDSSMPSAARSFFPGARDFTYLIPNQTGHDPNTHFSGPESIATVHSYLTSQGF